MNKEKIFTWLYRIFTFIVPCGVSLYTFLIEKLIDNEISVTTKIGISGIFILVIIVIIAVFFLGKFFKNKIRDLNDKILICTDNSEKEKLISKRKKYDAMQEMFNNACFIAPFIIGYFIILLVEKKCIDIRGTLFFISISMAIGFGFNGVKELLYANEKKQPNGEQNINKTDKLE